MSQYLCWNCGLMQGAEDDPMEASRLCASCANAMGWHTTRRVEEEEEASDV